MYIFFNSKKALTSKPAGNNLFYRGLSELYLHIMIKIKKKKERLRALE